MKNYTYQYFDATSIIVIVILILSFSALIGFLRYAHKIGSETHTPQRRDGEEDEIIRIIRRKIEDEYKGQ